jgi:hypothetical protein
MRPGSSRRGGLAGRQRPEAAAILGRPVADPAVAQAAAADLAGVGAGHVVITLGPDGAVLADPALAGSGRPRSGAALAVPGFSVRSVDSVGAGDAFVAALGVAVTSGATPPEAVRLACAVGATADPARRPGGAAHRGRRASRHARDGRSANQVQPTSAEARGEPRASALSAGVRSPLGEWHNAAPAERYSAKRQMSCGPGTRTHQRCLRTHPPPIPPPTNFPQPESPRPPPARPGGSGPGVWLRPEHTPQRARCHLTRLARPWPPGASGSQAGVAAEHTPQRARCHIDPPTDLAPGLVGLVGVGAGSLKTGGHLRGRRPAPLAPAHHVGRGQALQGGRVTDRSCCRAGRPGPGMPERHRRRHRAQRGN